MRLSQICAKNHQVVVATVLQILVIIRTYDAGFINFCQCFFQVFLVSRTVFLQMKMFKILIESLNLSTGKLFIPLEVG